MEALAPIRRRHLALQDLLRLDPGSRVSPRVLIDALDDNVAIDLDPAVQSLALGEGNDGRCLNPHLEHHAAPVVGRRDRHLASNGDSRIRERVDGLLGAEDEDDVVHVCAEHEAKAGGVEQDARGGRPRPVRETGDDDA